MSKTYYLTLNSANRSNKSDPAYNCEFQLNSTNSFLNQEGKYQIEPVELMMPFDVANIDDTNNSFGIIVGTTLSTYECQLKVPTIDDLVADINSFLSGTTALNSLQLQIEYDDNLGRFRLKTASSPEIHFQLVFNIPGSCYLLLGANKEPTTDANGDPLEPDTIYMDDNDPYLFPNPPDFSNKYEDVCVETNFAKRHWTIINGRIEPNSTFFSFTLDNFVFGSNVVWRQAYDGLFKQDIDANPSHLSFRFKTSNGVDIPFNRDFYLRLKITFTPKETTAKDIIGLLKNM